MRVSAVFAAAAVASDKQSSSFLQTLEDDMNNSKISPIKRILKLLGDMEEQARKDIAEDKAVYDKMNCWCNSNSGQKADAIENGEKHIGDLNSDIEAGTAAVKELQAKLQSAQEELEANEQALEKATNMRKKEKADFQTYEKEAIVNVEALKAAVMVLEKSNAGATQSRTEQKKDAFKHQGQSHAGHGNNFLAVPVTPGLSAEELKVLEQVVAQTEDAQTSAKVTAFFQQQDKGEGGEIFGIMNTLLEQMTGDLKSAQDKESEAATNFYDLRGSKESEIQAGEDLIVQTTDDLAVTNKKLADDKEDLADTSSDVEADKNFLANLKKTCANLDKEYAERSQTRHDELSALSETIDILTSDEAQTLTSFYQVSEKQARSSAAGLLEKANRRVHSAPLAALALSAKRDAFEKVEGAMETMVGNLATEQGEEVNQKEFCISELQKNEEETNSKENEKTDVQTKIDDLTSSIEQIEQGIATLKEEVMESNVQVKKASEDRIDENTAFKNTVAEAEGTVVILKKAEDRMKEFYGFIQQPAAEDSRGNADAKAPVQFKSYKKDPNAGGALGLIQKFVKEMQEMRQEAIQDEQTSQTAYENFLEETNTSIEAKNKAIVEKTAEKADADADKVQAEEDLASANSDLEALHEYAARLHKNCDWLAEHFDEDQAARSQEMEEIRSAESILKGAMQG
jgi:DNA repair exonuclease SbcCD ATPase subunit